MRKLNLLLFAVVFFAAQAIAQRVVTGKVTDDKSNPIPNASVIVTGTNAGTVTKPDGTYSITVPANAKSLTISFVEMAAQTIAIGTKTVINTSLISENKSLQEVVVTGYQTRRRKDEAGAIVSIKGSDISDMANTSIDKALQGAVAGVTVQANNGIPGGNIRVNIRGLSSFGSGTAPLWVIDGLPFPSGSLSSFTETNPLSFLNQNDIESIDILKDAASTAIYGSSGANGVILVTTKKGRNQKTRIGFNYYTGFNTMLKKFDVLNTQQFFQYKMEAIDNQNRLSNTFLTPQQLKASTLISMETNLLTGLSTAQINAMNEKQLDSLGNSLPFTDWQDETFTTGRINNYEMTLTGGTDKTQFYTSASFQKNNSIVKKTDFKRANIKMDITNNITSKLKVNLNAFLSTIYQNAPFATNGSFLGNPAFAGALIFPHNPVYIPGTGNYFGNSPGKLMGLLSHNVVAVNDYNVGYERTNEALATLGLDYKITPWLTFQTTGNIDYRVVQGRLFRDPRTPDGFGVQGRGTTHADWFINFLTNQRLTFVKSFNDIHNIDGVVGYEFIARKQEGFSAQKTNFTSYQLPLLTAGGVLVSADEYFTENKKSSVFGMFNYNYKRRYSIGLVARYDGSSRFGETTKFGFFNSIRGVWNVDRENFFHVNPISTLRIRASFGHVGNDAIGDYDALGTYGTGALYNNQPGISPNRLASSSLTWEDVRELNLGLDMGFFADRLTFTVDVYNKQTKNILQNEALANFTGWNSVRTNTGKLENRGIELAVKGDILRSTRPGGVRWNMSFVFGKNSNKILQIVNGSAILDRNTSTLLGKPIGQILTTRFAGINSSTGRAMWYDSLGNITYIPQNKDRYYAGIGGGLPPIQGGLSSSISYKGLSVDVQFSYQYGQLLSDGQYNFAMETSARVNLIHDNYDYRWTTPGQITHIPRANGATEPNSSGAGSGDRFLQKTDFIRLRSITLAYDFSGEFIKRLKLNAARFYVQGGNLFTYTSFKGYDPEFVSTSLGIVPQSKNITAGFQFSF